MVLGAYSNSVRATLPDTSVRLYTWMSVCLGLDFATNTFAGVIDRVATFGNLTEAENGKKRHVPGGGTLVIAQEQDKEGGLFSIGQMFSGDMAQMRMFSRVLSEEEMLSYVNCDETPEGDVLLTSFENLDEWDILGDVEVKLVPDEVLCEKKKREFIVLPEQRTFSEAQKMCEKLSLPMALPESEEENNDLFKLAVNVESLCLSSYSTNVWIGAQGNLEADEWQNLKDGAKLIYDNLDKRYTYITEASRCISQGGSFYPGIWYSTFCSRFKPCTACENAPKSSIRIRGLCRDSRLDREIHVQGLKNQKPMFQGTFYANVFWDNSTWVMTSRRYPDIRAHMKIAFIDDYPVGLQRWEVDGDVCPDTEMNLMMTVCGAGSFTCNDGTCVKISQRCDLQVNCDDKSDEHECDRVYLGLDYAKHIPPPPPKDQDHLNITFDLTITAVRTLSLLEQKLALDVIIVLQWVDSRLQYFNLQEQQSRNLVQDRTQMWQPRLVITDDTGSQVDFNERRAALVVVKESEPLPDDDTRVKEGRVALNSQTHASQGTSENSFMDIYFERWLNSLYSVKVTTNFNNGRYSLVSLTRYPFHTSIHSHHAFPFLLTPSLYLHYQNLPHHFHIFHTVPYRLHPSSYSRSRNISREGQPPLPSSGGHDLSPVPVRPQTVPL